MRVWKHLGVLAVTATAACGLDAAGEIATGLDAGTERIDTAAVVPDARTSQTRDASLPSHDASGPFDATLPKDAAEAGNDVSTDAHLDATNDAAKDAQHDSTPPTDVGTEDVTVHHLDGNKSNCADWNLAALCQRCHLKIQGRVKMDQLFFLEVLTISPWFKPHYEGYLESLK